MANNTLLNVDQITLEALMILKNELGFTRNVDRQHDKDFRKVNSIGDSIRIRKPVRYTVSTGQAIDIQASQETEVTLVLDQQKHVAMEFSSKELLLDVNQFAKQFIEPAVVQLANEIDYDGTALYKGVYNAVGTAGTVPTAALTYLQVGQKLDEFSVPRDKRAMVVTPATEVNAVDTLKGLFHASGPLSNQYRKGEIGKSVLGFDWYMDQNIRSHTAGTYAGTSLVNGASQTGSSLITDGWSSGASDLKEGDLITIANVYAVNPKNRQSTGALQQFVVTSDISDSSGAMTISISPSITLTGPYQTVNSLPANDAAVSVVSGTTALVSRQNLGFHRDAFTLGMGILESPKGVDFAAVKYDKQLGLAIRCVRQYDIRTDQYPCRLDILYGWLTQRPELACRLQS
jgi:hypothetical protein